MNKVSIIIPNYNGADLLAKNLPYVLAAEKYAQNSICEIIIVDDASEDASVEMLKNDFSTVRVIQHKINRGFSSAVNTGARSAKGNLLALLNSDVIPENNFLVSTLPHFNDKNVFAVSLNEQVYGPAVGYYIDGFVAHKSVKACKTQETFWVSGGSGIFRRNYWMKLNGLDEKLFNPFYWEDIDLCYRAQKRGWRLVWEVNSKVIHQHESTISKIKKKYRENIQQRNELTFIWKNITSPILFKKHLSGLFKRVLTHPGYLRIVLLAIARSKKIIRARKKEKKHAKVSDETIFAKFS